MVLLVLSKVIFVVFFYICYFFSVTFFYCDFEDATRFQNGEFCGFHQTNSGNHDDWIRKTGNSGSVYTGPNTGFGEIFTATLCNSFIILKAFVFFTLTREFYVLRPVRFFLQDIWLNSNFKGSPG